VGEKGPELVNLPRGSQVLPADQTRQGRTINNYYQQTVHTNAPVATVVQDFALLKAMSGA
jgi:hypothetical protein